MKYPTSMVMFLIVLGGLLTIACGLFFQMPQILTSSTSAPEGADGSRANGERIYFTATNQDGERITYRGGPNFGGMMMGTYLTCAACHGPEGRGGTHLMHMQVMDAPDIRYAALNGEGDEHGDEEPHGESGEYSLDDFHRAVVDGEHPDGDSLSRDMPRWQMSDADLADLFAFLKSLP